MSRAGISTPPRIVVSKQPGPPRMMPEAGSLVARSLLRGTLVSRDGPPSMRASPSTSTHFEVERTLLRPSPTTETFRGRAGAPLSDLGRGGSPPPCGVLGAWSGPAPLALVSSRGEERPLVVVPRFGQTGPPGASLVPVRVLVRPSRPGGPSAKRPKLEQVMEQMRKHPSSA